MEIVLEHRTYRLCKDRHEGCSDDIGVMVFAVAVRYFPRFHETLVLTSLSYQI